MKEKKILVILIILLLFTASCNEEKTDNTGTLAKGIYAEEIRQEEIKEVVDSDVFDWTLINDEEKVKFAESILRVWNANGDGIDITGEQLVAKINEQLVINSEDANILEKACIAMGIDSTKYANLYNEIFK